MDRSIISVTLLVTLAAFGQAPSKPAPSPPQVNETNLSTEFAIALERVTAEAAISRAIAISPDLASCRVAHWPDTPQCNIWAREMMKLLEKTVNAAEKVASAKQAAPVRPSKKESH